MVPAARLQTHRAFYRAEVWRRIEPCSGEKPRCCALTPPMLTEGPLNPAERGRATSRTLTADQGCGRVDGCDVFPVCLTWRTDFVPLVPVVEAC